MEAANRSETLTLKHSLTFYVSTQLTRWHFIGGFSIKENKLGGQSQKIKIWLLGSLELRVKDKGSLWTTPASASLTWLWNTASIVEN